MVPDWLNFNHHNKCSTDRETSFHFRRSVSNRTCAETLALIFSNDNLNNKPFGARSRGVTQRQSVHTLQATSGTPDSVGLSLEVSLCSALVSSHKDCDIAEYSWLCGVSGWMSLRGEMFLHRCLSLLMWKVECPSMKPTAGSACAGMVKG